MFSSYLHVFPTVLYLVMQQIFGYIQQMFFLNICWWFFQVFFILNQRVYNFETSVFMPLFMMFFPCHIIFVYCVCKCFYWTLANCCCTQQLQKLLELYQIFCQISQISDFIQIFHSFFVFCIQTVFRFFFAIFFSRFKRILYILYYSMLNILHLKIFLNLAFDRFVNRFFQNQQKNLLKLTDFISKMSQH